MTNVSGYNLASDTTVFPLLCASGFIIENYATRWAGPDQRGVSPTVNMEDALLMTQNQTGAEVCSGGMSPTVNNLSEK